jgi:ABC-type multidrug transport system ATPase subunit
MTTLTVKEAVYYSAQLQLPDSMSKSEKKERAEITIKEMGLQDAMNTRIGGWGAKGISGGQKRRVSICIEILTRPNLLFLDEPTSGLDSAASYYVMSRIARLDQWDGIRRTIIASIHQPSSEVFQLFHSLCLLSSGRTVYFGPASLATEVRSLMFLMFIKYIHLDSVLKYVTKLSHSQFNVVFCFKWLSLPDSPKST